MEEVIFTCRKCRENYSVIEVFPQPVFKCPVCDYEPPKREEKEE